MSNFPRWRTMSICAAVLVALSARGNTLPADRAAGTAAEAISDDVLESWVDQCVLDRRPPSQDKRFDEIGWVRGIGEAQRLAGEHRRPLFLFTHDGRMNLGRC